MNAFLQSQHARKADHIARQMTIPLKERMRLRAKSRLPVQDNLEGRSSDIYSFLRELYWIQGVTSMNINEILPRMVDSLHFIYDTDQAKKLLQSFARSTNKYKLFTAQQRHYLCRKSNSFHLFILFNFQRNLKVYFFFLVIAESVTTA